MLIRQLIRISAAENNVRLTGFKPELDGVSLGISTILRKLYNEHKRLCKVVENKANLRQTNSLWYSVEDNPYNVGTKWK